MFRIEYPRPQFVRTTWELLNGQWDFAFDDKKIGMVQKWYRKGFKLPLKIEVPFAFQTEKSGINDKSFHDYIWYKRIFNVPKTWNDRVMINFGAIDYESYIYINGELVGHHLGGNTSFSIDITDYLSYQDEEVTVYAFDPSTNQFIPRGKQFWEEITRSIWYDRTSGIWQSVFIEPVNTTHLEDLYLTPDIDCGTLNFSATVASFDSRTKVAVEVRDAEIVIFNATYSVNEGKVDNQIKVFQEDIFAMGFHGNGKLWSPENPYLFDIIFTIYQDDVIVDYVSSYFGMRKIHAENGMIFLNNKPYYLKLVLDQGYWPDGLLTAPFDDDYVRDIDLAKKMGFNGCRKHQKSEDSRFLYHADKMGFLVWGEMAAAANYSKAAVSAYLNEWIDVVERDFNHPSIIAWVAFNESWGIPKVKNNLEQQSYTLALYNLIHTLDSTRLVISNDGWEMTKTDLCCIHNYNHGGARDAKQKAEFRKSIANKRNILSYYPAKRPIYADNYSYHNEPIVLSEFGGIALHNNHGWGYTTVEDAKAFLQDYQRIASAIGNSRCLAGFCYTQLCDVQQEKNGLLTFDRKAKIDLDAIKQINEKIDYILAKKL